MFKSWNFQPVQWYLLAEGLNCTPLSLFSVCSDAYTRMIYLFSSIPNFAPCLCIPFSKSISPVTHTAPLLHPAPLLMTLPWPTSVLIFNSQLKSLPFYIKDLNLFCNFLSLFIYLFVSFISPFPCFPFINLIKSKCVFHNKEVKATLG